MQVNQEQFLLKVPRDPNRSEGLHLSTVIRALALDRGVLSRKYEDQGNLDENVVLQVGMAWEDFLAKSQHPEIEYHPGEIVLDGIAMTPDGVSIIDDEDYGDKIGIDAGSYVLHEFKATRKSSRGFEGLLRLKDKKCLLWLWQIMAYRYALNEMSPEMKSPFAKLHVLFLNGNYSRDPEDKEGNPSYKIYLLRFDDDELSSNWAMIRSYAEYLKEAGV